MIFRLLYYLLHTHTYPYELKNNKYIILKFTANRKIWMGAVNEFVAKMQHKTRQFKTMNELLSRFL